MTGASTAQLVIVLVDARHGLLEQSRRHAFLASLLGIRHLVLAVNKMDLLGWDQEKLTRFETNSTPSRPASTCRTSPPSQSPRCTATTW